jgi:IrrE N-terminal-like domain
VTQIDRLLAAKLLDHPELARPVDAGALRRILQREHVRVIVRPHARPAQLIALLSGWAIIVDERTTHEERLALIAHELGHLWLHHDRYFDRWEAHVYDRSGPEHDEREEAEADAFAERLLAGPDAPATSTRSRHYAEQHAAPAPAPEKPVVEPPAGVPTIPAERFARAAERQLEIENEGARERAAARGAARIGRRASAAASTSILTGRAVSLERTADDEQLKFLDEAKGAARFTDDNGTRWWIYDYDAGERRVRDFMSPAITHRVFINAAGVRRIYAFANGRELRALRVKHLERQLREAKP